MKDNKDNEVVEIPAVHGYEAARLKVMPTLKDGWRIAIKSLTKI